MDLTDRLRAGLRDAMRARDAAAVAALRSALAAVGNAGAVDVPATPPPPGTAEVAGAVLGLGAAEVPRRELTAAEVAALVRAEVADRVAAAEAYERDGRADRAERLRAEAAALAPYA
jgi:hypothetical protein